METIVIFILMFIIVTLAGINTSDLNLAEWRKTINILIQLIVLAFLTFMILNQYVFHYARYMINY